MSTILVGAALAFGVALLLIVRFVLGVIREALQEIARDEIKAAIPKLSFGLVRRAAFDLPEGERSIVEEWEARLDDARQRPFQMLRVALAIYRERGQVAAQAMHPVPELGRSSDSEFLWSRSSRVGSRLAGVGAFFTRRLRPMRDRLSGYVDRAFSLIIGATGIALAVKSLLDVLPLVTVLASAGAVAFVIVGICAVSRKR